MGHQPNTCQICHRPVTTSAEWPEYAWPIRDELLKRGCWVCANCVSRALAPRDSRDLRRGD